jgi:hypothetical protein
MIIKEYGKRSLKYISRYPRHYGGYVLFAVGFYGMAKYFKQSNNEIIRIGFAGSIAQFLTEIIYHPMDVINTRTKAEIAHKDNINTYKMIRRIIDKEGLYGFWRGASSTFYGALLGGMIYFSTYKYLKNHLKQYEEGGLHTLSYLTSSLLGESLFLIFYYPYDLIRTRMQTRFPGFEYKGPLDGCRKIVGGKLKNVRKLYVGATPSFVLNLSNQTIMFTVLESMREYFLKKHNLHSVTQLPLSLYLYCSIAAGVISGAVTNLMEVVTIHKQVDPKFKLVSFIEEQGVKALTQGLFARVTINVFHSVTLFFVVDEISKIFNVEL